MYVEEFSPGYYISQLIIEPNNDDSVYVNDADFQDVQYELYSAGEINSPVIFQIDRHFLDIEPDRSVPASVLEIPDQILEYMTIPEPPTIREIFIPKPWMYPYLQEPNII